ncbi:unnamed protein product [Mycena citricolor]|uniref:DHHA2 domain-containing protein n=1 Tax=Mycena citricolor TaxID=2018698 RepID=A0AAD2JUX8_9AGAR|nr:unnamed protein product [Mycena citricolor]
MTSILFQRFFANHGFRRLHSFMASPDIARTDSSLCSFLIKAKAQYLQAQSNTHEWTIVMGNEAGDLDSIASAIAFAWIESAKSSCIPLIQMAREDLILRPENMHALALAGIQNPAEELLTLSDISPSSFPPSIKFALVDHNRLGAAFPSQAPVVAVIDHHDDEGLYTETAHPRKVAPAGSCASHVAQMLLLPAAGDDAMLPVRDVSTLLLSAILIDTNCLKPGGKALDVDREAVRNLIPRSAMDSPSLLTDELPAAVRRLSDELASKKLDVSHLSTWDLLRRDYKEYTFSLNWIQPVPSSIHAGLASVSVGLKDLADLENAADKWMATRNLTVFGVLTSFRDAEKLGKTSGKPKHRREMAWFIRSSDKAPADELASRLQKGLEQSEEIRARRHEQVALEGKPSGMRAMAYEQGNAQATRKASAPLLRSIMESKQ